MVLSYLFISYKQNHSILLWRPTFNLKSGVLASATWPRERHDMRSMYIVALMTSAKRSWPKERLVLKLSIIFPRSLIINFLSLIKCQLMVLSNN